MVLAVSTARILAPEFGDEPKKDTLSFRMERKSVLARADSTIRLGALLHLDLDVDEEVDQEVLQSCFVDVGALLAEV